MRKVLFLSFSGYSEYNGISKKKLAQIEGLKECGCVVVNCYYDVNLQNGHRLWMADESVLIDLGKGIRAKIRKRIDYALILAYIKEEQISFVYMRSEHNSSPFLIRFVKQLRNHGVEVVMEIPTFPYDQEYITFKSKCSLHIDKLFRRRLAKQLNAIVTFSDQTEIFGQRTIRISNGIDFSSIKLKQSRHTQSELHLIGVAEIHYWHGFDRVVAGLADYYKSGRQNSCRVYFHIVGEFSGEREKNEILPLVKDNQLENYVFLHGQLFGTDLDELFDRADMGIGSLARHRSNITYIKTLKNREYAARGIPFIYSEIDEDFEEMLYVMKFPADESPINIESLIEFYREKRYDPFEIRESVAHLSWKNQMQKVLDIVKRE
ncbi:MAG: glycosyltransferase family 1 protein [Proteiniphilum sp.]|uniref:glycosyltransferase family 1 protein n=1 Tax=Proteiniphilum sp. TaxID=1926877 RepID=UPI002B21BDD6|nr:glycosyltransferase family 1 protein [Proteiniphilum sp.]MEA5129456.1 glycosyltransferase family 1 protein [Proteiniphilum sp.]